ncbi:MAG: hypothetical protein A2Y70_04125 [Candidatus Aminicenantes bacterium RBG_13_64_14]|nr:MAG: hypothetical protein A2Y70_04125 [Candidatus Aminicenantes bacterium RBG_13_64_14]
MSHTAEHPTVPTSFLDDIEKRVSEIFSAQKNEVEQGLIEKINREKEEALRKIEAVNQEFTQVRGFLDEHKAVMAELQGAEENIRAQIRGHFDRAVNFQKMMENAAGLAGNELERISGLNQELEKIRVRAEDEYQKVKRNLAGYAGIAAQIPAPAETPDSDVDWNGELLKLKKVRDLLATLRQAEFTPAPEAVTPEPPAVPETVASSVSAEDDGVRDDVEFAESDPAWGDIPIGPAGNVQMSPALVEEPHKEAAVLPAEPRPAVAPAAAPPDAEHESIMESLARYRRIEPVNNGIELGFFAAKADAVLDAESFMTAVGKIIENAGQLHAQLGKTGSVKDLFLLKQEILNQQEVLRKVFFRVVRFCDKENGKLPETFAEVISSQGMKDIIERLTMANWSDPSDFKPFLNELKAMKRAFEVRIVASGNYAKAVLDQVEGRN